jgi:U32 family peptidase
MKIELLAPAGNLEKLKIAIHYGADAVYIAGQQFGLRSAADNFSRYEVEQAIFFAHHYQKKVYLTLNAYLHHQELKELPEFLGFLNDIQPDGVICSDLGVVNCVRQNTDIPIHISTQASVLNQYHAKIWRQQGASRIVVGRELNIPEAAALKKNTGLAIEMFIHGAMCMSYSGQCSISNYTAGRDSNRGGCIQSCRFKYKLYPQDQEPVETFFMSSKDLQGIRLLEQFKAFEIDSLKIEGRMKSNLYIASTVRAYSQALQQLRNNQCIDYDYFEDELKKIPNREYTTGSLISAADDSSVYDQQDEVSTDYEMAGNILEIDYSQNRCAFQAKNKIQIGDKIEILTFSNAVQTVKIERLINMSNVALTVAQPNNIFWIPWQEGVAVQNVARMRKNKI